MDGINKKNTSHRVGQYIKRDVTTPAKRLRATSADAVSPDELVNRVNGAIGETALTRVQTAMPHGASTSIAACPAIENSDAWDTEGDLDRGPQGAD